MTPFERVELYQKKLGLSFEQAVSIIQLEILDEIKEGLERGDNGNTN